MQARAVSVNEACNGPLSEAFLREMYRVRAWAYGVSFVIGAPLVLPILTGMSDRRAWRWVGGSFVVWKVCGLIANIGKSPECWEPYENKAPFWNDEVASVAWVLQPIAYFAFSGLLVVLLAITWVRWLRD